MAQIHNRNPLAKNFYIAQLQKATLKEDLNPLAKKSIESRINRVLEKEE